MIEIIKGISVQTNQTRNINVRQQIISLIEGKRTLAPLAFLSKGGRIYLCKLSNGEKIYLPTSFPSNHDLFIVQVLLSDKTQIIAKVFSRYAHYRRVETFLIKDGTTLYYEAMPLVEKKETSKRGSLSASRQSLAYRWGVQLQAWWKMETNEPPVQIEKKLSRDGIVHLCPFNKEPVSLKIDANRPYEKVAISPVMEDDSRWVSVTLKNTLIKEFWLVKDGKIYFPPMPK